MLFSSVLFLYLFLPLTLLGYYLCFGIQFKNAWLVIASLIFFAWGGVSYTLILIGSIFLNYIFALLIGQHVPRAYWYLFASVACNILLLGVFKYANFVTENVNCFLAWLHLPLITPTDIRLPIGISFYTFHSLSYLIDIYRGKSLAQKNILNLSLYISMFSQLIAGPIIRYSDMSEQLEGRRHSWLKFSSGIERFILGLAKKVLLANVFADISDKVFAMDPAEVGSLNTWLGIVCYTLQIYYDFSGYSDMAIGLGRMFGFEFMENFNFPYMAQSVKDFWRRWHISLSSFFRDYVYIPLGGNRKGKRRMYLNLLIVFVLTGFWHGASWNFLVWGLFHGTFIILEHLGLENFLKKIPAFFGNIYALGVVMLAWVFFRADDISYALKYFHSMFSFSSTPLQSMKFFGFMNAEVYIAFIIAISGALGLFKLMGKWISKISSKKYLELSYHFASAAFYLAAILLCTMYLVAGSYNPFIYFRF